MGAVPEEVALFPLPDLSYQVVKEDHIEGMDPVFRGSMPSSQSRMFAILAGDHRGNVFDGGIV